MTYRYHLRDRKTRKIFERDQTITADCKVEARKLLAAEWSRDVPRGRHGTRDVGYVPWRDVQIVWVA